MGNTFNPDKLLSSDGEHESISRLDDETGTWVLRDEFQGHLKRLGPVIDLKKTDRDGKDKATGGWRVSRNFVIIPTDDLELQEMADGICNVKIQLLFHDDRLHVPWRSGVCRCIRRLAVPVGTASKLTDPSFVPTRSTTRAEEVFLLHERYVDYLHNTT